MNNKYFKPLFGCFLFLTIVCNSGNLLSQEINLDETVKYINNRINLNINHKEIFEISEYGDTKLTIINEGDTLKQIVKFNLNDIDEITYLEDKNYFYCTRLSCASGKCIKFYGSGDIRNYTSWEFWSFCNNTESDAKALVKAFNHLKSLIKTDPFK